MTSKLLEALYAAFDDARYVIAEFGSRSKAERDVLILDSATSPQMIEPSMREYAHRLVASNVLSKATVISRHEHRSLDRSKGSTLHVLYYPSFRHLISWELPSFLCSVAITGSFVKGDADAFVPFTSAYRSRQIEPSTLSLYERQQFAYDAIATSSLLYALQKNPVYPKSAILEDLSYATRFSLAEYLQEMHLLNINRTAWAWDTIESAAVRHFSERSEIQTILRMGRTHWVSCSAEDLPSLFMGYFSLRDDLIRNVSEGGLS